MNEALSKSKFNKKITNSGALGLLRFLRLGTWHSQLQKHLKNLVAPHSIALELH